MAQSKVENNDMEDFLEEDKPIQGQKYVCLSFISPENVLDDNIRNGYIVSNKGGHYEDR